VAAATSPRLARRAAIRCPHTGKRVEIELLMTPTGAPCRVLRCTIRPECPRPGTRPAGTSRRPSSARRLPSWFCRRGIVNSSSRERDLVSMKRGQSTSGLSPSAQRVSPLLQVFVRIHPEGGHAPGQIFFSWPSAPAG